MNYDYKAIGERIRDERKKAGMSQSGLAVALNLSEDSRSTIAVWEKMKEKKDMPSLDYLLRMCDLFHCELSYLLCEIEQKSHELTDIVKATGLSSESIMMLKYFIQRKNADALDLINRILTDAKVFRLSKATAAYIEMNTVPRLKGLSKVVFERLDDEKYKNCDAIVEETYGRGNAAVITGSELIELRENYIKNTFLKIINEHDRSWIDEIMKGEL